MQLVVDGLKLQPCYPSFIDARDAIIQADKLGPQKGANICALWRGFAFRGLGVDAGAFGKESYDVPTECR